jgi:hypothetical protein
VLWLFDRLVLDKIDADCLIACQSIHSIPCGWHFGLQPIQSVVPERRSNAAPRIMAGFCLLR